MLDAFPNENRVNANNLRQFATAVAGLLHISDFQRRRITHMMRHYRDMRRRWLRLPLAACLLHCQAYYFSLDCFPTHLLHHLQHLNMHLCLRLWLSLSLGLCVGLSA